MTELSKALPEFRAWLERQENIQKVGVPRRIGYCPVAMWLKEVERRGDISVESMYIRRGSRQVRTPKWVRLFISRVDRAIDPSSAVVPRRIALDVLDGVAKDMRRNR